MMSKMRHGALLLSLVVAACGGAAGSPAAADARPAATAAATAVPRIGDEVSAGNWRYSVRQVDTVTEIPQLFGRTKPAKGAFVLVWLELTNIGRENYIINQHDFEIHDGRDAKYTYDYDSDELARARRQQQIGPGEKIPPGVKVTTSIAFDVAPGTTGMRLYLVQAKRYIRLE